MRQAEKLLNGEIIPTEIEMVGWLTLSTRENYIKR